MPYVKLDFGKYIEEKPQPEGFFDALLHKEAYSREIESGEWERKLEELLKYLINGELPEGVGCKSPKISPKMAKEVLWFLQEVTKIIPDRFAICDGCGCLYSEDYLKYFETNGKFYCDSCRDYAPVVHCEECGNEAGYKTTAYSKKYDMYLCKDCKKEKQNDNQ